MNIHVFCQFARVGIAEAWRDKASLLSSAALMIVLLYVFSAVWRSAASGGLDSPYEGSRFLWYIVLTELVMCGTPLLHRRIQESIFCGEYQARLVSPHSHLLELYARGLGEGALRVTLLLLIGFSCGWYFSGSLPGNMIGFFASLLMVPLGVALLCLCYTSIGLSAAWFGDVLPFYWVIQKTLFVFGGLLTPLTLYPGWLREIALLTPCSAMLYGTAKHVFEFDIATWLLSVCVALFWGSGLLAAVWYQNRCVTLQILTNGK